MGQERFRKTGEGSFFGELVYQRAVPQGHFLRKLRELLPGEALTQEWVALYKGGAEYGPPLPSARPDGPPVGAASPTYHPSLVLKMLLLAYLYNLSERQVDLFVNDSLSAKFFLGLGADEPCPDSTTLTVFKRRLLAANAAVGTGEVAGQGPAPGPEEGHRPFASLEGRLWPYSGGGQRPHHSQRQRGEGAGTAGQGQAAPGPPCPLGNQGEAAQAFPSPRRVFDIGERGGAPPLLLRLQGPYEPQCRKPPDDQPYRHPWCSLRLS